MNYPCKGFGGVDFMLCPACGGRGEMDDELTDDLKIRLECGSCGNKGSRWRGDGQAPTEWERGAGDTKPVGESVLGGDVRVTIGREMPCEASQNGVVVNLVGPYDSVLMHLSKELRALLKDTLEDTSQMGI